MMQLKRILHTMWSLWQLFAKLSVWILASKHSCIRDSARERDREPKGGSVADSPGAGQRVVDLKTWAERELGSVVSPVRLAH
jgi:hypothetical protein